MAIGSIPTQAQLNAQLSSVALGLRTNADQVLHIWSYANDLGLAGLEALGFGPADAQAFLNSVNYMATIAQIYKGTAVQDTLFNFEDALAQVTGPY